MCDIIRKLPEDLINRIIPYTYSLQSKELTEDIISYFNGKKIVNSIYYGFWINDSDKHADKCWLINDLFAFANDYNPTMFGYKESFYKIFSRNIMLKNDKNNVNNYIIRLESEEIDNQINIFWGLFTPEEREDFIDIANIKIRLIN